MGRTSITISTGLSGKHESWSDQGFREIREFDLGQGYIRTRHRIFKMLEHTSNITGLTRVSIATLRNKSTILFSDTIKDITATPSQSEISNPLGSSVLLYFAAVKNIIYFAGENSLMYTYTADALGTPTTKIFAPTTRDGGKILNKSTGFAIFDSRLIIIGGTADSNTVVDNVLYWSAIGVYTDFESVGNFSSAGFIRFSSKISYVAPLRDRLLVVFEDSVIELVRGAFLTLPEAYLPNRLSITGADYSGRSLAFEQDSILKLLLRDGVYNYNFSQSGRSKLIREKTFDSTLLKNLDKTKLHSANAIFAPDISNAVFTLPTHDNFSTILSVKDETLDGFCNYHDADGIITGATLYKDATNWLRLIYSVGTSVYIVNDPTTVETEPFDATFTLNPISIELESTTISCGSFELIYSTASTNNYEAQLNILHPNAYDDTFGIESFGIIKSVKVILQGNSFRKATPRISFAQTSPSIFISVTIKDVTTPIVIHGLVINTNV